MPNDLSVLTCGTTTPAPGGGDSEIAEILGYIQRTMDSVVEQIAWLGEQEFKHVSMLGPFLGRSLLELAVTALIGRLDPLRLLLVRQIQSLPNYDTAVPWKAAIRWQGDVIAESRSDLWGKSLDYEKVTKALLGDYYDHLSWRPAFVRMAGFQGVGSAWLAQLSAIDAEAFIPRKREELGRLYSSLSKGIHHEFVMPPGTVYDRDTIVDLVRRTVHAVADLGLVSQFIPHALALLSPEEAIETFSRIEDREVMK